MIRQHSTLVFAALALTFSALAACGDDGGGTVDPIDAGTDGATVSQTCDNYCTTIATNCTSAGGALNTQYGSAAECLATCATWATGTAADMSGNTRGCHIYHAGVAAGNPGLHCKHAGPGGDGACGSNCEGFCSLVMSACAGQAAQPYPDMPTCMTACAGFATAPAYDASQTGGNTFACRLYHATAASTTPAVHCAHVGVTSPTCN